MMLRSCWPLMQSGAKTARIFCWASLPSPIWDERLNRLFCCRDHTGCGSGAFLLLEKWNPLRLRRRYRTDSCVSGRAARTQSPETSRSCRAYRTLHPARRNLSRRYLLPPSRHLYRRRWTGTALRQTRYWEPEASRGISRSQAPRGHIRRAPGSPFSQAVECRLDKDRSRSGSS